MQVIANEAAYSADRFARTPGPAAVGSASLRRSRGVAGPECFGFRTQGVVGLQARPRPPVPGPQQKLLAVFLPQTVHHSPRALGMAQERWTLQALQNLCGRQTGQRPSLESIRRALKRFGYSGKRAQRTITSPDPDYQAQKGP